MDFRTADDAFMFTCIGSPLYEDPRMRRGAAESISVLAIDTLNYA